MKEFNCLMASSSLFFILLILFTSHGSATCFVDSKFAVDYPERVFMNRGENKTINFTVLNINSTPYYVYIDVVSTECCGFTSSHVVGDNYGLLRSNESMKIKIALRTTTMSHIQPGAEDVSIHLYWGTNLTIDDHGNIVWDTVEGWSILEIDIILIDVKKDNSDNHNYLDIVLIFILLLVVIRLFFKYIKRNMVMKK